MKRVEVTWEDSAAAAAGFWKAADETLTPVVVKSIGYVHQKTKRSLVLISGAHSGGTKSPAYVSGMQVIPCSAIRKVRKL